MSSGLVLVTNALHQAEGAELGLHPALQDMQSQLIGRRRQWFRCADKSPLGWYAALVDTPPAALLAARCADLPASARQVWVASPYHAQLGRDSVRLLSEVDFPWDEADSTWLCDGLNPLLLQEGMSLHACAAALLLACSTPLDAHPVPFAAIAGGLLPNRHPEGPDGGHLARLLSEIQMTLHANPQPTRVGKSEVHGLWFWGGCPLPALLPVGLPPVATSNVILQSLGPEHGAEMIISEVEGLPDLLSLSALPDAVILAGAGHAVCLNSSLLPRYAKGWRVKSPAGEADLFTRMRGIAHVA